MGNNGLLLLRPLGFVQVLCDCLATSEGQLKCDPVLVVWRCVPDQVLRVGVFVCVCVCVAEGGRVVFRYDTTFPMSILLTHRNVARHIALPQTHL